MRAMKVTAKADYAVRSALELATVQDGLLKGERIANAQGIPLKFLENILIDLRHAGIVHAQRGAEAASRSGCAGSPSSRTRGLDADRLGLEPQPDDLALGQLELLDLGARGLNPG